MDDMSLSIDHNISIMTVLDLQNVACKRIRGHGLNKIQPCLLERDAVLSAVFGYEEVDQIVHLRTTHLITRSCVWYNIDNATLRLELVKLVR